MKKILLFGAGKSATCLIDYLIEQASENQWKVIVADEDFELAKQKTAFSIHARPVQADVRNDEDRNTLIEQSDIVISLLPPFLHSIVAKNCVLAGRHLLTASYMDEEIKKMGSEVSDKGLLFLCEMGLDPGIDHMSAMQLIHRIRAEGGEIHTFYSHCGGLVSPESDDNPLHYKISWNPRNVVIAGKDGATYRVNNEVQQQPYYRLFDPTRVTAIAGYGDLAWYPNRNSLPYISLYGLEESRTFVRTTLRHPDFCSAWKKLIELKLTDEVVQYNTRGLTYGDFFKTHLSKHQLTENISVEDKEWFALSYLGFFEDMMIGDGVYTAADMLQKAMEKKLKLQPEDKDMVIMQHEIEYKLEQCYKKRMCTLIVKGENSVKTAMAKTVGLPLGIAASLLLQKKITLTGLHIPTPSEIYQPVLSELQKEGIIFKES